MMSLSDWGNPSEVLKVPQGDMGMSHIGSRRPESCWNSQGQSLLVLLDNIHPKLIFEQGLVAQLVEHYHI